MTQINRSLMAILSIIISTAASPVGAQVAAKAGDPESGQAFALKNCASCHSVSARQVSPPSVANAPSFSSIAAMPSTTEMSLQAFLSTPHPKMPNYILHPNDATDVIAYILSLRGRTQ